MVNKPIMRRLGRDGEVMQQIQKKMTQKVYRDKSKDIFRKRKHKGK